MKKLLFMALFPILLYGQYTNIPVVGSTTDLSAYNGKGLIILNTDTDGGFFIALDSTYGESGTYAYAHPTTGLQWVRLGYAGDDPATFYNIISNGSLTLAGAAEMNGDITLENDEILSNSTDGDFSITFNDDDDSLGQLILKSSITGTAVEPNNHLDITFEANDGGSTNTEYAKIITTITDTARASEDASIKFQTITAGTSTLGLTITGTAVAVAGALSSSSISATSTGATIITGSVTATDSSTSAILKDSAGKKWKLKVNTEGIVSADSTGLN